MCINCVFPEQWFTLSRRKTQVGQRQDSDLKKREEMKKGDEEVEEKELWS